MGIIHTIYVITIYGKGVGSACNTVQEDNLPHTVFNGPTEKKLVVGRPSRISSLFQQRLAAGRGSWSAALCLPTPRSARKHASYANAAAGRHSIEVLPR